MSKGYLLRLGFDASLFGNMPRNDEFTMLHLWSYDYECIMSNMISLDVYKTKIESLSYPLTTVYAVLTPFGAMDLNQI